MLCRFPVAPSACEVDGIVGDREQAGRYCRRGSGVEEQSVAGFGDPVMQARFSTHTVLSLQFIS